MHLKPNLIHILCLISLTITQFSDVSAMSCDSHEMDMMVEASSQGHMEHDMNHHDMSKGQSYEMHEINHEIPCCDECDCDYSNCHSPLMLTLNSIRFDYTASSNQKPFNQLIHHKNLPSHPYRPPIG